jgi:hypothetical protein
MAEQDNETQAAAPAQKTNKLGLSLLNYRGGKSTLCAGCGHDAISAAITQAYFELGMNPRQVAKLSASAARRRRRRTSSAKRSASTRSTGACRRSRRVRTSRTAR